MILYFLLLAFFILIMVFNKYITELIYKIISEIEPDEKISDSNKK